MADVTSADVRSAAEHVLGEPVSSIELVARSSNHVFKLVTDSGARYSLRVPFLDASGLSAFWQQLRDTFGLRYGTQLRHVGPLAQQIDEDQVVTAARPVARTRIGGKPAYLSRWIDGTSWEPDEFPDSPSVHEQLGRYLARLHARRYDRFGTLERQPFDADQFVARANASMSAILRRYWTHRPDIVNYFECRISQTRPADLAAPAHLAPIMPDISANQFVYANGRILSVVDLDSYVIGPREVELATVELCLTSPADFRRGYEEILPLPRFERFRAYCRFWLMINDLDDPPELTEFLATRTLFD